MITLEQSTLEVVRALPPEKQQEILEHAEKLRRPSKSLTPRWSGKGLWAGLHITLTAEEIEENQREMWKNFPLDGISCLPLWSICTRSLGTWLREAALDQASADGFPFMSPLFALWN